MPIIELDSSGNVANINVFAPDGLVGRKEGSTWTYYTFDQQGNVAQRLNSSQVVQTSRVFDAWGEGAETTLPRSIDCWNYNAQWGYYYDRETSLYYCQNRMYDASTGRWINRDPIGYAGGINLYGYCGGGPVGASDPSGLAVQVAIGAGVALVAGAAAAMYLIWTRPETHEAVRTLASALGSLRDNLTRRYVPAADFGPVSQTCSEIKDVVKPGKTGSPGSIERGWNTTRRYGPDGYPETDRDWDPTHNPADHVHDLIPRPGGGFPERPKSSREPRPGDPPPPRNHPGYGSGDVGNGGPSSMGGEFVPRKGIIYR